MVGQNKLGPVALVLACGTSLFSDGYLNGVLGSARTFLKRQYGAATFNSGNRGTIFSGIGFVGIVVGQLTFGFIVDRVGRRNSMFVANIIVIIFSILATGAYATTPDGIFRILTAWRFFQGIGIGGEYPAGSIAAAEATENEGMQKGRQNMWFSLATNSAIDFGFVVGAFVPYLCVLGYGATAYEAGWRTCFGVGIIWPLLLFFIRFGIKEETDVYKRSTMSKAKQVPWRLIFKRYWVKWLGIALVWFMYDFISYPFGIYSSTVVDTITGSDSSLKTVFGWNTIINLFYMPGTLLGALVVDRVGAKRLLIIALLFQAVVGFLMSGLYVKLTEHIAAFAVVYGIFLAMGEVGPGNCIGLLAAKSSSTAVRGRFYGTAAAVGKIGAYVGTWAFPALIADFPADSTVANTGPFYLGSGLAILSAIVTYFMISPLSVDQQHLEDIAFKQYLADNGYDITQMGLVDDLAVEGVDDYLPAHQRLDEKHGAVDDKEVLASRSYL